MRSPCAAAVIDAPLQGRFSLWSGGEAGQLPRGQAEGGGFAAEGHHLGKGEVQWV